MTQSRETAEATFAEAFEASLNFKTPEQGELLRGQVVSISGDDAFVSYGGPSEAVMDSAELEGLEVGDMVEGTVVRTSPEIPISRKMARGKASLELLRGMFENRVPVEGKSARAIRAASTSTSAACAPSARSRRSPSARSTTPTSSSARLTSFASPSFPTTAAASSSPAPRC